MSRSLGGRNRWRRVALAAICVLAQLTGPTAADAGAPQQGWAESAGLNGLVIRDKGHDLGDISDRMQIVELLARWGIAYDEARADLVADLFTTDASLTALAGPQRIEEVHGRNAIVASVRNASRRQGDQRRHLISNIVINELHAGEADVNAYGLVGVAGDSVVLGATVFYRAHARKDPDGVWRFSKFTIGVDQYSNGSAPPSGRAADKAKTP